jgi:hypothetical protein
MSTTFLGLLLTLLPLSMAARAASAKKVGDESAVDQKEAEARWKASGLLKVTTKTSSNEVPLQ